MRINKFSPPPSKINKGRTTRRITVKIKNITSNRILTSSGAPTIQARVKTGKGEWVASVPSGTSTGKHEAKPFPKKGVSQAVKNLGKISKTLEGKEIRTLKDVKRVEDDLLKKVKSLGGNTVLCVSYALIRALAKDKVWKYLNSEAKKVPAQLANMIGGGSHVKGNSPDVQEYLVTPTKYNSFEQAVNALTMVHERAGEQLSEKNEGFAKGEGLEGAWSANTDNTTPLNILEKVTEAVTDRTGVSFRLGLDVAASEFWNGKNYAYKHPITEKKASPGEQVDIIRELVKDYKLFYVEDPVHEDDYQRFAELNKKLGGKCLVCGDDLLVTNVKRLKKALKQEACNAAIVKPNQVGSFFKTTDFVKELVKNNVTPIISHRSRETNDSMIADLAVAYNTPYIKVGISGGERVAKLNRLMEIEDELNLNK